MIKYIIAFLLCTTTVRAGIGIGVTPYPGPGVFVGGAPAGLSYVASTSAAIQTSAATTLTISKPAGSVAGDLMILVGSKVYSRAVSLSGWTEIPITGGDSTTVALYKVATSSDDAVSDYTFNISVSNSGLQCALITLSGSYSSISGGGVTNSAYTTALPFYAPTVLTPGAIAIWFGAKATLGDTKTLSSITRGSIVYNNTNRNANVYALWAAVETDVSAGSPITAASGVLSAAGNSKSGSVIWVLP